MHAVLVVVGPLLLSLALAGGAAALAAHRRVPAASLPLPVAGARRRGEVWTGLAALAGAGTAAACLAGAWQSREERLVVVLPLAGATAYALVALLAEATWPRPATRVRSARLLVRSVREGASPGLLRCAAAGGALLAAVCLLGAVLGAEDGRSVEWSSPDGLATWSAATFPGVALTAPIAALGLLTAVATAAVLHLVPVRPSVPAADDATDAALRRVAAHRVLRTSTAAAVLTLGGLLLLAGTSGGGLGGDYQVAAGTWRSSAPPRGWRALAGVALWSSPAVALAGLVTLFWPAPGLRRRRTTAVVA
ncbi:hypothetical protein MO973_28820 [Paenibacillus sp. TRM 82003]|uniref:hypothetical protein n=1 Tax=Kineococcus sp. TRM81007 TaxID=2925831 RepID=UPI001F56D8AE|nr:hypothetical protein [Kineococcus sp. TRM81007]MCI2238830.1 hypothetical protein [Kineococcus sp. TRM81007]MCI3924235.1 hypothetical protein [Paenibacillus sp. TRM 82003]